VFGHTHSDMFSLFYSYSNPEQPIGVMTVCGSITTWNSNNPSFCEITLDAETLLPINRSTQSISLADSNTKKEMVW
jgi:hypothetical protein